MRLRACVVLALAAIAGCAPPRATDAREAIVNGVPSTAAEDATVGLPFYEDGKFMGFCSGVLVAANLVLTARHCVSMVDDVIACDASGTPISGAVIHGDRAPQDLGVVVGPSLKYRPGSTTELALDAHGVELFVPDGDVACDADLALVLLDRALDAPIASLRLDGPPTVGESLRAVGWGYGNDDKGIIRRDRTGVAILALGPSADDPGFQFGAHEFEVGESICQGDSGGPAFDEITGAVVGITSRGGNGLAPDPSVRYATCVDTGDHLTLNLYTRIDGWKALIEQSFAVAGAEPWREGGPDPREAETGEPCDGSGACPSATAASGCELAGRRPVGMWPLGLALLYFVLTRRPLIGRGCRRAPTR